jgi:transposase
VVKTIADLSRQIRGYDRQIEATAAQRYPEVKILTQIAGVGVLTALTYVLVLEEPHRFKKSRSVGAYLGLRPRLKQSGQSDRQLRITKAGDHLLRRLLVGSGHYILGPFGPDCDLRRWGMGLAARGGKNAKKRAVVAVARKLSVLLHRLWVTGEAYEPLRAAHQGVLMGDLNG